MKVIVIGALVFAGSVSTAQIHKVDLKKEMVGKAHLTSPLAKLKRQENQLQWKECAKTASTVFNSQKDVRGWIAVTWIHCLEQEQKKKADPLALEKPLMKMASHPEIFLQGSWSADLQRRWVNLRLSLLEKQLQKKMAKAAVGFEGLLDGTWNLEKEQKARAYQGLGDGALQKLRYEEARFFYEQAQNLVDSKYLQEKIAFLLKVSGAASVPQSPEVKAENGSGDEVKLEERLRLSLKNNDPLASLQEVMNILNQYPGSRVAKRLKDKPLEIYSTISDSALREKALAKMAETDSSRLLDWSQSLHRRSDYEGALFLAQKMAEQSGQSPQSTQALWVAGRSAHFLGRYEQALGFFASLMKHHAGSDEAAEALFRSALIYYRQKDFSSSVAYLERLLQQGRERYDLVGRYWLVRSLEEVDQERAKNIAKELTEKYPFSYYGLRLQAEAQGGKFSWPVSSEKAPSLVREFYLVGGQKASWQRFKILSDAGWVNEAQSELQQLPFIKSPELKVALAQKLVTRDQYATAIRLINEAMEKDVRLRREEFVRLGYPEVYPALYGAEAERYGIQKVLLWSLTRQESAFNLQAVSTSNALGLMQMIPPTAQEVARKLGLRLELPEDMYRPEVNIPMGSFYVSQMLDQFGGHVPLALAAYNAGPGRVKTWLEARPELRESLNQPSSSPSQEVWFDELPWTETSFYVKAILRNIVLYRLVLEGNFVSKPVLWQDLLNKKSK